MRDFIIGFLSCLGFIFLISATPINNRYDKEEQIFNEFTNVFKNMQSKIRVFTSTPNLTDIGDGELVLVSSTTKSMMFRFDEKVWNVKFSTQ